MQRFIALLFMLSFTVSSTFADTRIRVGMEADDIVTHTLFSAISEHFHLSTDYVYYPSFNDILTAVETGEVDFAANVTFTEERSKRFDFSSPTNIEYTYLFTRGGKKLEQLGSIGVPKGTIYGELIAKNYPHITQVEYDGQDVALRLFKQNQIEGIVDAINQLKPLLLAGYDAQLLNHQISIKPVSLIATKGKHLASLEEFEALVHSAQVQKALRENITQYQFDLRQEALRNLATKLGVDRSRPLKVKIESIGQYAYYQDDGKLVGITPEVLFSACEILQFNCQLMSQPGEAWETMYDDFLAQKVDVISPIAISEPRKEVTYFSKPYFVSNAIIVKREGYKNGVYSNVSELIIERIGVVTNDIYHELLLDLLPQKDLHTFSNDEERINALLSNEIDYIIINRSSFNKVLRESKEILPLEEDSLIRDFYSTDVAIGFAKTPQGQILAELFSQAITMLNVEKIVGQYNIMPDWKATLLSEKRLARLTLSVIILILIASLLLSLYFNHQSNTDNLTRLKNRRALTRRYNKGVQPDQTLVYLDVNKFKPINDTYGHEVGDQVLKELAHYIMRYWKGQSYRIGGDEFILVGTVSAVELSHALLNLQKIKFRSSANGVELEISVAFGVSKPRRDVMSLENVMHEADLSMYANKRKARLIESRFVQNEQQADLGVS